MNSEKMYTLQIRYANGYVWNVTPNYPRGYLYASEVIDELQEMARNRNNHPHDYGVLDYFVPLIVEVA